MVNEWVSEQVGRSCIHFKSFVSHHFPPLIMSHAYFKTSKETLKQIFLPENNKRVSRSTAWHDQNFILWAAWSEQGGLFIEGRGAPTLGVNVPFHKERGKTHEGAKHLPLILNPIEWAQIHRGILLLGISLGNWVEIVDKRFTLGEYHFAWEATFLTQPLADLLLWNILRKLGELDKVCTPR